MSIVKIKTMPTEIVEVYRNLMPWTSLNQMMLVICDEPFQTGRGSPSSAMADGAKVWVCPNSTFDNTDLTTIGGHRVLAHEMWHAHEWLTTSRIAFWAAYVGGVAKSLLFSRKWYDHQYFDYEQRAIAFSNRARDYLRDQKVDLSQFKGVYG